MLKDKFLDGPIGEGMLLKLYLYEKRGGFVRIVSVERADALDIHNPETSSYIKELKGTVNRKTDASFAFINQGSISCYISPVLVEKYKLKNGSQAGFIAALVYNKKRYVELECSSSARDNVKDAHGALTVERRADVRRALSCGSNHCKISQI